MGHGAELTLLPPKAESGTARLRNVGDWIPSFERETSFKVDWERGGWSSDMERIEREQMAFATAPDSPHLS